MQREKNDAKSGVFQDLNESKRRKQRRNGRNRDQHNVRINIRKKNPKYLYTDNIRDKNSLLYIEKDNHHGNLSGFL